jgi:hypothetical protein
MESVLTWKQNSIFLAGHKLHFISADNAGCVAQNRTKVLLCDSRIKSAVIVSETSEVGPVESRAVKMVIHGLALGLTALLDTFREVICILSPLNQDCVQG